MFNRTKKPINTNDMKNMGPSIGKAVLKETQLKSPNKILNRENLYSLKFKQDLEFFISKLKKHKTYQEFIKLL